MRISKEQLQKIIAEEVRAHVKKKLVTESVSEPRTVKATPAMLKRIIAEEAARINEMRDEDDNVPYTSPGHRAPLPDYHDHPDNTGTDHMEDYYQRQDPQLKAAADAKAVRNKSEKLEEVIMSSNFHRVVQSFNHFSGRDQVSNSILIDPQGNILCDLNNPYDDCTHALITGMANFRRMEGNYPNHSIEYINRLREILASQVPGIFSPTYEIKKLEELLDLDKITQEEFQRKKEEINQHEKEKTKLKLADMSVIKNIMGIQEEQEEY